MLPATFVRNFHKSRVKIFWFRLKLKYFCYIDCLLYASRFFYFSVEDKKTKRISVFSTFFIICFLFDNYNFAKKPNLYLKLCENDAVWFHGGNVIVYTKKPPPKKHSIPFLLFINIKPVAISGLAMLSTCILRRRNGFVLKLDEIGAQVVEGDFGGEPRFGDCFKAFANFS